MVMTHCFDRHKGLGAERALGCLVRLAVVVMLVGIQHVVAVCWRKLVHCVRSHVVDADGVHGIADGRAPCAWRCKAAQAAMSSCHVCVRIITALHLCQMACETIASVSASSECRCPVVNGHSAHLHP